MLALLLVVAVREPLLSTWPEGPLQAARLPRGLGLRSAQVLHEEDGAGSWSVRLRFDEAQSAAYTRLTDTLVDEPAPRDELAIILDGPPGGLVLAAPLVERARPLTYLDLDGGPTEASARALLQSLLR